MMMKYVWYASYGSNMNYDRFLTYIKGGEYAMARMKQYKGCTNKKLPIKTVFSKVAGELMFGKEQSSWGEGGVAFFNPTKGDHNTWMRYYLIETNQFEEVYMQENGREVLSKPIDYKTLLAGNMIIPEGMEDDWYGKIVCLGQQDDIPILTFTSPATIDQHVAPTLKYMKTIIMGLLQNDSVEKEEICTYLEDINRERTYFKEGYLTNMCNNIYQI